MVNIGNGITKEELKGSLVIYDKAADAKAYIDSKKDITKVDDQTLISWYGQLARAAGNKGAMTEYYSVVLKEVNRRGGYEKIRNLK